MHPSTSHNSTSDDPSSTPPTFDHCHHHDNVPCSVSTPLPLPQQALRIDTTAQHPPSALVISTSTPSVQTYAPPLSSASTAVFADPGVPSSTSPSSRNWFFSHLKKQSLSSPFFESAWTRSSGVEAEEQQVDPSAVPTPTTLSSSLSLHKVRSAHCIAPADTATPTAGLAAPLTESDLLNRMIRDDRHPFGPNLYTRFFRLDCARTRRELIVEPSRWIGHKTGALAAIRIFMFLYSFIVLLTDLIVTERPQYSFCYLTQLSYLGLVAYLGATSWHTLSEWQRQRQHKRALVVQKDKGALEAGHAMAKESTGGVDEKQEDTAFCGLKDTMTTTLERQHWLLTDLNFFLYHTICTFHVIVPILYWGYNSISGEAKMMAVDLNKESLWRNYSFHGLDLVLMLVEVAINSMPFVPSHLVIVIVIALLYLAEAHIVHAVDGFWIYPFLDMSNKLWALMYLGVGFVIVAAFFAMYYLHRFKHWLMYRHHPRPIPVSLHIESQKQALGLASLEVIKVDARAADEDLDECPHGCSDITLDDQDYAFKASTFKAGDEIMPLEYPALAAIRQDEMATRKNRQRSCSNCSMASSVMTLVGSDDDLGNSGDRVCNTISNRTNSFRTMCAESSALSSSSSSFSPTRRARGLSDPLDYRRHHRLLEVVNEDPTDTSLPNDTVPVITAVLSSVTAPSIDSTNNNTFSNLSYQSSRLDRVPEEDEQGTHQTY